MQFAEEQMLGAISVQEGPDIDNMTYEELLNLGEQMGHVSKGLSEHQIRELPIFQWRDIEVKEQCIVCQEEKLCGELVR